MCILDNLKLIDLYYWTLYASLSKNSGKHKELHSQSAQNTPTQNPLNIINLSTYSLTQEETNVLSKGLTFCPVVQINKFDVIKDTHLFI